MNECWRLRIAPSIEMFVGEVPELVQLLPDRFVTGWYTRTRLLGIIPSVAPPLRTMLPLTMMSFSLAIVRLWE